MTTAVSIRRNAASNMAGRGLSAIAWLAVTPGVLGWLGTERFALWSLFFGLGGYFATLDLGMANSAIRYVSLGVANGDRREVASVVRRTLALTLLGAAVWALAVLLLGGAFLDLVRVPPALRPEASAAIRLFALEVVVFSVAQVLQSVLMGFQRLDLSNASFLAGLALHVLLLVAGMNADRGLPWTVGAMIAGQGLAATIAAVQAWRLVSRLPGGPAGRQPVATSELLRFGVRVQATNATAVGQLQVGRLLLGALGQLAWITPFELGFRIANALWALPTLIQGAVIPAAAAASAAAGPAGVREVYRWADRWVYAAAGVILSGAWLLAPAAVWSWLGPGHDEAARVARYLSLAFLLATVGGPAGAVARGAGWAGLEATAMASALGLNVALSFLLVPPLASTGAALAMALSYALSSVGLVLVLHRRLVASTREWLTGSLVPRLALPLAGAFLASLVGHPWRPDRTPAWGVLAAQTTIWLAVVALVAWRTGDLQALANRLRAVRGTAGPGMEIPS